jgi:hypothetical protein
MNLDAQWTSAVLAAGILLACGFLLPGRRARKTALAMLIGGAIGAVAYPLVLCLFMGVAAGASRDPAHFGVRFRHAFRIYALSATLDAMSRGTALGMLTGVVLAVRRGRRASTGPALAGPDHQDLNGWTRGPAGEGDEAQTKRISRI